MQTVQVKLTGAILVDSRCCSAGEVVEVPVERAIHIAEAGAGEVLDPRVVQALHDRRDLPSDKRIKAVADLIDSFPPTGRRATLATAK